MSASLASVSYTVESSSAVDFLYFVSKCEFHIPVLWLNFCHVCTLVLFRWTFRILEIS